jgi:uncharacterized protein (UPF0548 family)
MNNILPTISGLGLLRKPVYGGQVFASGQMRQGCRVLFPHKTKRRKALGFSTLRSERIKF